MSILEMSRKPRGSDTFETLGDVDDERVGRPLSKSRSGKTVFLLLAAVADWSLGDIDGVIGRSITE